MHRDLDTEGRGEECPRCQMAMAEFMGLPLIVASDDNSEPVHISRGQRICCACGLVDPWDTSASQPQLLSPSKVPAQKLVE